MSDPDPEVLAERLDDAVRAAGSPERAAQERRYLRSESEHYGASVGSCRSEIRRLLRDQPLDHAALVRLAQLLWSWHSTAPGQPPVHERRLLAALLLNADSKRLRLADFELLEAMLREARTWALVDVLACDAAGPAADRLDHSADPADDPTPVLSGWATDRDFWLRRSALLVHDRALRAGGGNWTRFAGYADCLLSDREFFVRKAIGWVLRDTSRRRPELVLDWLLPRAHRAAGLTVREAVKYLPAPGREAVLAAAKRTSRG